MPKTSTCWRRSSSPARHLCTSERIASTIPTTSEGEGADRQEVDEHRPGVRHTDGVRRSRPAAPRWGPGEERARGEGDHASGCEPGREPGLGPAVRKHHRQNQHEHQPADPASRSADHAPAARTSPSRVSLASPSRPQASSPSPTPQASAPASMTRAHPVLGPGHLQDHSDHGVGEDHGRDGHVVEAAAAPVREQHRGERAGGSSATGEQRHPQTESAHPRPPRVKRARRRRSWELMRGRSMPAGSWWRSIRTQTPVNHTIQTRVPQSCCPDARSAASRRAGRGP